MEIDDTLSGNHNVSAMTNYYLFISSTLKTAQIGLKGKVFIEFYF